MIIRGVPVIKRVILTQTSELLPFEEQESDLLADERRDSFLQGEKEGEKQGYEKTYSEISALYCLLQTIVRKLLEQKERLLDQLKPEIITFSLQVCEKIVRRELTQPEPLIKLINTLLQSVISPHKHERIHIVLAPDDLALLELYADRFEYDHLKIDEIKISADPLMRRGDVRIETKFGLLNYDISREFFELKLQCLNC